MKARAAIIIGVAVVASMLLAGGYSVYAANTESTQKYPPVVEKLVTAFHLDRNKVDKVLGEYKQEREAQHKTRLEERLSQAVKDGKITEKQKEAILKKMDEMKTKLEEIRNIDDPTKRRAAIEKLHVDLQAWAKKNGLDQTPFVFGFGGHGRGMRGFGPGFGGPGFGGPGWHRFGPGYYGPAPDSSTTTTSAQQSSTAL
ncbi:MAG TPA: hypothetical protein VE439_05775 [Anaerolineae bacterium]|jgi:outer membrane murein-binding lipoprotein Lpp|nr:hypothetical protein [Anaerolineae bacterium]